MDDAAIEALERLRTQYIGQTNEQLLAGLRTQYPDMNEAGLQSTLQVRIALRDHGAEAAFKKAAEIDAAALIEASHPRTMKH